MRKKPGFSWSPWPASRALLLDIFSSLNSWQGTSSTALNRINKQTIPRAVPVTGQPTKITLFQPRNRLEAVAQTMDAGARNASVPCRYRVGRGDERSSGKALQRRRSGSSCGRLVGCPLARGGRSRVDGFVAGAARSRSIVNRHRIDVGGRERKRADGPPRPRRPASSSGRG